MNALFKKLNYKDQPVIVILNAPDSFGSNIEQMRSVAEVVTEPIPAASFAIGFAKTRAEVDEFADWLGSAGQGDVVAWIAYPKGSSKKHKCEFNRDTGWERLGHHGFEPVRQVSIDDDWSALRFRRVEHIKTMTRSFAMTEQGAKKAASFRQGN